MLNIFKEFVSRYDLNNPKIQLKYNHTLRVMDFCVKIAQDLKLSKKDIEIAKYIGLFHDYARFEQATKFDTFDDSKSFDHAKRANEILFDENEIAKYKIDSHYYDIIKKAIFNHNKYKIEDNLSDRELLFSRIIRDADKLDINNIFLNKYIKELELKKMM